MFYRERILRFTENSIKFRMKKIPRKYFFVVLALGIIFCGLPTVEAERMSTRLLNRVFSVEAPGQTFPRSLHEGVKSQTERFLGKVETGWMIVVAPHPDDEILCCSETIRAALAEGTPVKIVFVTDGDAGSRAQHLVSKNYGKKRCAESVAAAQKLGIPETDLLWLNFPDQHVADLPMSGKIISRFTGQGQTRADSFAPGTLYNRLALEKVFAEIFRLFPPKNVYVPTELDTHPDHRASGDIVRTAIRNNIAGVKIWGYQIHGRNYEPRAVENVWKKDLIQFFQSQFHDEYHQNYLERFADFPEQFVRLWY